MVLFAHGLHLLILLRQVWIRMQCAASSKILRKCSSFALPSHGPHSHILSPPNYLNVKILSCALMPLDSCLLELWGYAARRHRSKADMLSFLPHMGRASREVSTQPGGAGGIGLGMQEPSAIFLLTFLKLLELFL